MNPRTVDDYLNLPYTIEVIRDDSGDQHGWVASVVELQGCLTQADTFDELENHIKEAMRLWIGAALEDGIEIPEPRPEDDYSGKFVVRVPVSLHRTLAIQAEREGVSLNSYINVALASYTGRESSQKTTLPQQQRVWPGLSTAAFQAMVLQGLEEEAQQTDEVIFGQWLRQSFLEIETAYTAGHLKIAASLLQNTISMIAKNASASPVLEPLVQTLKFQQVLLNTQVMNKDLLATAGKLHDQIENMIGKVNNEQQGFDLELGMNYAEVTTHSESQLADDLFKNVLPGFSK